MQRDFGNLQKSDQMLLLGKNTSFYVQFILASYFCQKTGQKQLNTIIGNKYCTILEEQTLCRHSMLRKITANEFCRMVQFFKPTADMTLWEKLLERFNDMMLDSSYTPFLLLMILYDTTESKVSTGSEYCGSKQAIEWSDDKFENNLAGR